MKDTQATHRNKTAGQLIVAAGLSAAVVLVIGAIAVLLSGSLATPAQAETRQQGDPVQRTITVVGTGTVSAAPDEAQVNLGVQINNPDVQAATQEASDTMDAVIAALTSNGVDERDIQTAYYNLYVDRPFGPNGQQGEPTYQVSNNVQVTVRNLDNLTAIIGAAVEAGANNINNVSFNIGEPADLRAQARESAVNAARAKAEELADLNGVVLGEVVRVSEVIDQGAYFVNEQASFNQAGLGGGGLQPGEVDITAQLQITYAIVQ